MHTSIDMVESISEISYKIHMIIGFGAGMFSSLVRNNVDDFLVTFLMGACGALGAGIVKAFMDYFKKKTRKQTIRDIVREEMEEYD